MMSTHRQVLFILSASAVASMLLVAAPAAAQKKVACTGTSAMMGLGSSEGRHVPDEMGKVLGAGFTVSNHGVQGTTAINSLGSGYAKTAQYRAALALNPDIVLFWFGGNDSFAGTWENNKASFKPDYAAMVKAFQALPTKPKTFLVRLWVNPGAPVRRNILDQEILPIIDEIAAETGSTVIDYRTLIEANPGFLPDGMHPNNTGTAAIGKLFADAVLKTLGAPGADGGTPVDAGGGETAADAGPSPTDVPAAETAPGTGGTGGTPPGGTGGTAGGGSGGAAPGPSTGSGGQPGATGSSGGCCRIAAATDPDPGPPMLLLLALGFLTAVRRQRR